MSKRFHYAKRKCAVCSVLSVKNPQTQYQMHSRCLTSKQLGISRGFFFFYYFSWFAFCLKFVSVHVFNLQLVPGS